MANVSAFIIALYDNQTFYNVQTGYLRGSSNIIRSIISLKNSQEITSITMVSNKKELFSHVKEYSVEFLLIADNNSEFNTQNLLKKYQSIPKQKKF